MLDRDVWSVLDIGCGDGRVAANIRWHGVKYTGIDCSNEALANPGTFYVRIGDALYDELPPADLVLLKEVTQHLPNTDVSRLMDRLKVYPLVLHCSGGEGVSNVDIAMGDSRRVDMSLAPFSLPVKEVLRYGPYICQLWEPK